jgi:H+/Cl- antiporter ClcA
MMMISYASSLSVAQSYAGAFSHNTLVALRDIWVIIGLSVLGGLAGALFVECVKVRSS